MVEEQIELLPEERISQLLRRLLREADGRSLSVREMVAIMHGRGLQMIIVLLCLPFVAPVSIPGLAIPFGVAIAFCGLRVAFGHKPWLPGFILNRQLPYPALEKIVHFGCRIYERAERGIRPRALVLLEAPGMGMLIGVTIAINGIFLSLPIPGIFPLTNTVPSFSIIFLCLGLMERDGALIIGGYFLTLLAAVYFALIFLLGKAGCEALWHLIFH